MFHYLIKLLLLICAFIVLPDTAFALDWEQITSGSQALPNPQTSTQQTASLILDIDKDGDNDFVVASRTAPNAIVWFRRGSNGWTQYVIDNSSLRIEAGGDFYDIDTDGDLDIVFAADGQSNFVSWWENPYPNFSPTQIWIKHFIKNTGANKHHDLQFGDVDGDSKAELVFWNQEEPGLYVAEIPTNPKSVSSWARNKIYTATSKHEGLAIFDIDSDGKKDIIGGGLWFKHTSGVTYQVNTIDNSRAYTRTAVGQLIPGGRPEVVLSAGDEAGTIDMYSWNGNTWSKQQLSTIDHGHSLQITDIDGNGTQDIFSAEMRVNGTNPSSKVRLFLNNGNGTFATEIVATGFDNHESKLGDLDNDDDLDILGKPYNHQTPKLNIWLQQGNGTPPTPPDGGGGLDSWQRHVIDSARPWKSLFIYGTDLDGDSKKDIVTGGWWYKNPGSSSGNWGVRKTIGSPLNNAVLLNDFDKDGDVDIFGSQWNASAANPQLAWAQNNGNGTFAIKNNIAQANGDFLQGAAFSLSNARKIALSWHRNGNGIQQISVPENPVTQSWSIQNISTTNLQEDLSAEDIDRDGDSDLLLGTKWLRNNSGSWSTHTVHVTSSLPDRNELIDMDKDGKLDALIGYEAISKPGVLAWYKQGVSADALWSEKVIANDIIGPMSVDAADMDGDGDIDVVVGEHNTQQPATAKLFIYENTGNANSWEKHLVYTGDEHHMGAQLSDIDSDGDLDILSIGWTHGKVILYENLGGGSIPTEPPPSTTPPTDPAGTNASLKVLLHGLGKGGDNANPISVGNMDPIRIQRSVGLELFNTNNQSIGIKQGNVNFDSNNGSFQGVISLGTTPTGNYTARLSVPGYLRKSYTGIISITANQTTQLPPLALTAGDSNNDNSLSILDYNIILDCYSELTPAQNCSNGDKKLSADLTDDGKVNQFDYNLFLRELSTQGGGGTTPQPTNPNPTNTPPTGATNTPNPPGGSQGEIKLFDEIIQFSSSDNGFHRLHEGNTDWPTHVPSNWKQPTDYFNSTWQYRIQVTANPTNQASKLQLCFWKIPGFSPENCAFNIDQNGIGTYTYASSPAINGASNNGWARINGGALDFLNPREYRASIILRGPGNCVVTTKGQVSNKCPELWNSLKDLRFKLTVIMVPSGRTFSGWSNY